MKSSHNQRAKPFYIFQVKLTNHRMIMKVIYTALVVILFTLYSCKKAKTAEDTLLPQTTNKTIHQNLVYASGSNSQKLDLYLPETGGAFPLVIWIHGGGWQSGDKAQFANTTMFKALISRGYAVASINYRLSGEAKFPAQIYDVKSAVRWLRANATFYKLNSTRFGAWGSSAGGHLTALLATSGGVASLEDLVTGNSTQSSRVQVAVDWFGPANLLLMEEMAQSHGCLTRSNQPNSPESQFMGFALQTLPLQTLAASPVSYVSADDPPMYIQHGKLDCTVSYLQSQLMYDSLLPLKSSGEVMLKLFENSGHGGNEFEAASNISGVVDFLDRYLK